MRYSTACSVCRMRRKKCKIAPGCRRCVLCEAQNLVCSRAGAVESPEDHSSPKSFRPAGYRPNIQSSPSGPPIWDKALCVELVDLYFKYIHDQFHSIFHRPSFMKDLENDRAPKVVVYAMMAMSARFSTNSVFRDMAPTARGEPYAKASHTLLNLREVSISSIQACVLLGAVSICEGEPAAETVFYAAACRIANCLDLPNYPASSTLEKEVCLRIYWTLCMIDVWSSDGMNLPRQMTRRHDVPLPMDEEAFLALDVDSHLDLDTFTNAEREDSLLAQMIKLNTILLEVNDYMKDLTASTISFISEEKVDVLSQKLDSWLLALPAGMRDNAENLQYFASKGLGRFFVAIYLGYYHFGQLLFYQYLDEQQRGLANSPKVHEGARKCKEHAMSLSRIIDTAMETIGCDVKYTMVGHITVVASSVQIHTLLFGTDEKEITEARNQLERNFNNLVSLRKYWPALEVCFSRLKTFHELCLQSVDTSYRMDKWMLRFLTEFARPIEAEERQDGENSDLDFNTWLENTVGFNVEGWD